MTNETRHSMTEYEIYLPVTNNDGTPVDAHEIQRVKELLVKEFGGYTHLQQRNDGAWRRVHRVQHVIHQLSQCVVDLLDRLRHLPQKRVWERNDRKFGHAGQIGEVGMPVNPRPGRKGGLTPITRRFPGRLPPRRG